MGPCESEPLTFAFLVVSVCETCTHGKQGTRTPAETTIGMAVYQAQTVPLYMKALTMRCHFVASFRLCAIFISIALYLRKIVPFFCAFEGTKGKKNALGSLYTFEREQSIIFFSWQT